MSPSLSVKQSSLFIGQTITLIPSNPFFFLFLTAQEEVCKGETDELQLYDNAGSIVPSVVYSRNSRQ